MDKELFSEITHPKKRAFLTAYAETGTLVRACEITGISKSSHYRWRDKDAAYREAFEKATECAADNIEDEAYRRAVEGWEEPVGWYKGKAGGVVRRYSDTLLIFLLKGLRPEKYADRHDIRTASNYIDISVVSDLMARRALPHHVIKAIGDGDNVTAVVLGWMAELRSKGQEIPAGLLMDRKGPGNGGKPHGTAVRGKQEAE